MEDSYNSDNQDFYLTRKISEGTAGALYHGFHTKLMKPITIRVIPRSLLLND